MLATQAGTAPTFTSRYADPNHPAASGNLISLVTGGKINPQSRTMNMPGRGGGLGGMGGMRGRGSSQRGGLDGGLGRSIGRGGGPVNMLVGALLDRGSRGQSFGQSSHPQQQYKEDQNDRQYVYSQGQSKMSQPLQDRGHRMPGNDGDRFSLANNPISNLNPLMGIKRILKQVCLIEILCPG